MLIFSERTTMKARIRHDLSANPVDNAESRHFMRIRTEEAMKPKNKTRLINDDTSIAGAGFIHAGTANANATFGGFIVCFSAFYTQSITNTFIAQRQDSSSKSTDTEDSSYPGE